MSYLGIPPFGQTVRTVTTIAATTSQTLFTPTGGYTVGYCDVFYNGIKLVAGTDFTATDGLTVVLTAGATSGAVVEIITYGTVTITDAVRRSGDTFSGAVAINSTLAAGNTTITGNTTTTTLNSGNTAITGTLAAGNTTITGSLSTTTLSSGNAAVTGTATVTGSVVATSNSCTDTLGTGYTTFSGTNYYHGKLSLQDSVGRTAFFRSPDSIAEAAIGTSTGHVFTVVTNNVERLRVNTTGTISLQGATIDTTGTGITFPATQSASSDANTLDDYEEGTWTPTYAGYNSSPTVTGYWAARQGKYVKIGKMVYCYVAIAKSGNSSSGGSGSLLISGLPFTSATVNYNQISRVASWGWSPASPDYKVDSIVVPSGQVWAYVWDITTTDVNVTALNSASGAYIVGMFMYEAAA